MAVSSYHRCRDSGGKPYRKGECPDWPRCRRWQFSHDLGHVFDRETGKYKRQQLRRTGYTTKKAAEQAEAAETVAVAKGTAPDLDQRRMTVAEWLDKWLEGRRRKGLRVSSQRTYEIYVKRHLKPTLGHLKVVDLRPNHIDQALTAIREGATQPRVGGNGKPSSSTVKQAFSTLRSALNKAIKARIITWNPCEGVEPEPVERQPAKTWTEDQRADFLAYAEEQEADLAIGYRLALTWGLRRGEIAALRWANVDLDHARLTVAENAVEVGGEVHIGAPKTAAGERMVPLDTETVAALRAHRKRQNERRMFLGEGWEDHDLVVADWNGAPVKPHRLTTRFRQLADEAGLERLKLHEARHTAVTHLRRKGVPSWVVQSVVGHTARAMTDHYSDTGMDDVLRDAAAVVSNGRSEAS